MSGSYLSEYLVPKIRAAAGEHDNPELGVIEGVTRPCPSEEGQGRSH